MENRSDSQLGVSGNMKSLPVSGYRIYLHHPQRTNWLSIAQNGQLATLRLSQDLSIFASRSDQLEQLSG